MDDAVARVINVMHERFDEPLSLADMARTALLSPFHFSRVFRRSTGVSPGRFLTAIRLYEAKRLLLTTSWNVADISCRVGYSSVGTFTTRFTQSVGTSPARYRHQSAEAVLAVGASYRRLPKSGLLGPHVVPGRIRASRGSVTGRITLPPGVTAAATFVGAFDGMTPQRHPHACQLLPDADAWRVDGVSSGTWTMLALVEVEPAAGPQPLPAAGPQPWAAGSSARQSAPGTDAAGSSARQSAPGADTVPFLVGASKPVEVHEGAVIDVGVIRAREPLPTDPPVLLVLPVGQEAA